MDAPKPLSVVIITEAEPFYLSEAFCYLFNHDLAGIHFVRAYVIDYFRPKINSLNQVRIPDFWRAFGPSVFMRSIWRLILGKLKRSKDVKNVFEQYQIPVVSDITDINRPDLLQSIAADKPDLIVSVAVNQLFSPSLCQLPPRGCLNLHSGIQPQHRGKAAIFWALADGCDETGVIVHFINDSVDNGNVLVKKRYTIEQRSYDVVLKALRMLAMDAIIEALIKVKEKNLSYQPGQHQQAPLPLRRFPNYEDFKQFIQNGNRIF